MSKKKRTPSEDVISLIYTRRDSLLYGCVQFFWPDPNQQRVGPFRQSHPFIISQSIGKGNTVVYGSVRELIEEIRRLIDEINECNNKFSSTLHRRGVDISEALDNSKGKVFVTLPEGAEADELFFSYVREITKVLLLLSCQTRNLFHLFPRFNSRRISQFGYEGQTLGTISLKELFDYFVHNRYLYVDGEYVIDLFSDKIPRKSPIAGKFMGYKINWREFIEAIRKVTNDVTMRDLTGMLRGRLKKLSSKLPHNDIIFLIQNLESFSILLTTKIPDKRYRFMLNLMFDEIANQQIAGIPDSTGICEHRVIIRGSPRIKVHGKLSERKFRIRANCRSVLCDDRGQTVKAEELKNHTIYVGYEYFFDLVNNAFGDDPLMSFHGVICQ